VRFILDFGDVDLSDSLAFDPLIPVVHMTADSDDHGPGRQVRFHLVLATRDSSLVRAKGVLTIRGSGAAVASLPVSFGAGRRLEYGFSLSRDVVPHSQLSLEIGNAEYEVIWTCHSSLDRYVEDQ
jgi:hypothetical protein